MPQPLRQIALATLALTVAMGLAACGRKDDPLPPLRYVPAPTRDLSVHQQGPDLILNMAYPQSTTSGQALPGLDSVEIWWHQLPAGASSTEVPERTFQAQATQLFLLSGAELQSSIVGDRIETRFTVPETVGEDSKTAWAVRSVGSTGEISPFSNLAGLAFAARLDAPSGIELTPEVAGVRIDWTTPEGAVGSHIYRRNATQRRFGQPLHQAETDISSFLDRSARYSQRYIYTVRAIAALDPLVESDPSSEREIHYRDTFAPAPPESLIALGERGGARLVMEASPSRDAVGYIIYREDPQADFRRVTADPVASLEFRDSGLTTGLTYRYYAVAVDGAGNEGEPSSTATVTVP